MWLKYLICLAKWQAKAVERGDPGDGTAAAAGRWRAKKGRASLPAAEDCRSAKSV